MGPWVKRLVGVKNDQGGKGAIFHSNLIYPTYIEII